MTMYKEIVTKAVIGKGKKNSKASYEIKPDETPNTVLGCWVINHRFSGNNVNGKVEVIGSFDVNVWYSYANDSKTTVVTERFNYNEKMNLRLTENNTLTPTSEIIVRSLNQPTVTNVSVADGIIKLNVEKELGIEIIGDTKVKINTIDEEDDYEVIEDQINDDAVAEQIDTEVNEEFLD